jgi:hypothetical protein
MISQKIKTLLFPVKGLDLEPPTPEGDARIVGDLQPTISMILGKSGDGTVVIEGTDDGALKVADTGSGLELVEVSSGVATDTLTDLGLTNAFTFLYIIVKNARLKMTYETSPSTYSTAIELEMGESQRDMGAYDIQVANAAAGVPATYQVEAYR